MLSAYRCFTCVKKMASVSKPVVVVLGATGTGKSKLAIEIAQKFDGAIISADSMQVYKGLDIITNKVTAEEQSLVKHHLLDFVDPLEDFYVHHFRDRALEVIEQLHAAGKLPVIVGGTHYYIESVLWQVLVGGGDSSPHQNEPDSLLRFGSVSEQSFVSVNSGDALACKPCSLQSASDSCVAREQSVLEVGSENNVACKPSAVELTSENREACKPSAVELTSENREACKPSAVELRSENIEHCRSRDGELGSKNIVRRESSASEFRNENSEACKPCVTELSDNSVCESSLSTPSSNVSVITPFVENISGVDTWKANQERDGEIHPPVCHRYDASSGDRLESVEDFKCSTDGKSTVFHGSNTETIRGSRQAVEPTWKLSMEDPTHVLHARLMKVDPKRARTLHPNDRRKIIRSLEVWQQTGLPHSEHLRRQRAAEGGSVLGGGLRYPNTVVLWVSSDQEVLDARLDARVDDMLEKGLIAELLDFHDRYNKSRLKLAHADTKNKGCHTRSQLHRCKGVHDSGHSDLRSECLQEIESSTQQKKIKLDEANTTDSVSGGAAETCPKNVDDNLSEKVQNAPKTEGVTSASQVSDEDASSAAVKPVADYTLGIFQSIGFKEFHDYLVLSPEERESEKGQKFYENGIERLKLVTRRYARRQIKWIRKRFTGALGRQVPPMYLLDTTDPRNWQHAVYSPAEAIVGALLKGEAPPSTISPVHSAPTVCQNIEGRYSRHECSVCERVFIGDHQWEAHLASNAHRKCKARKRKLAALQSDVTVAAS